MIDEYISGQELFRKLKKRKDRALEVTEYLMVYEADDFFEFKRLKKLEFGLELPKFLLPSDFTPEFRATMASVYSLLETEQ